MTKNFGKIKDDVLRYITRRPGEVVFAVDISKDTKWSVFQVQQSVYGMRERNSDLKRQIQVVQQGRSWRYVPDKVPGGDSPPPTQPPPGFTEPNPHPKPEPESAPSARGNLFEQIGQTKKGTILVQGESGAIFKLVELEG